MRGNAVKCHTCEKFAWQLDNGTAPMGWLQLVRVESSSTTTGTYMYAGNSSYPSQLERKGNESRKDFCTAKCLRDYIKEWK